MTSPIVLLKEQVEENRKRRKACSVCRLPPEAHEFILEAYEVPHATVRDVWIVLRDEFGMKAGHYALYGHCRVCLGRPWSERG